MKGKMKKFCPGCGKETENLVKGLCKDCFSKKGKAAGIPDKIELEMCSCGRIKQRGKWKREIKRAIWDRIKLKGKVVEKSMDLRKMNDHFKADVEIREVIDKGKGSTLKKEIDIKIKKSICRDCARIRGGHYEAVIQLRGSKEKVDEAVKDIFEKVKNSKERKGFITDIKKRKVSVERKKGEKKINFVGIDIYLGSKNLARRISKETGEKFGIKHKESYTLAGMKDGKKFYRNKMLLRF